VGQVELLTDLVSPSAANRAIFPKGRNPAAAKALDDALRSIHDDGQQLPKGPQTSGKSGPQNANHRGKTGVGP
jgi:hypothetical protein